MNLFSVISEFNPFHNGHKYLIKSMREQGATHVVAIMSGNFTQRGEPAIISKYARTKSALENGVDLVVLMPVTYSTASAESYAFGGVTIAEALGCCNSLFFGSECGDIKKLEKICETFESIKFKAWFAGYVSSNESYARAIELSLANMLGNEYADIIRAPNNLLAVEYVKAIRDIGSSLIPKTIIRSGVAHDSQTPNENYASASFIRSLIKSHSNYEKFIPEKSYEIICNAIRQKAAPVDFSNLEKLIIYRLRTMTESEYKQLPNISEGIENRLRNVSLNATNLEELFDKIKTKRYPNSRLRRLVLRALLHITESDCSIPPQYIRVLGFNEKGKEILREMRKTAKLPIVMKAQDIKELSLEARRQFECESIADDIYALALPKTGKFGKNFTENIIIR